MKFIFCLIILLNFNYINAQKADFDLKAKLSKLKMQTVELHNEILKNNKDLREINIDIKRNKQKQLIYNQYIEDKEEIAESLVYLMRENIYLSQFNSIIKNIHEKSDDFVTKQLLRKFYLDRTKSSINNFFLGLEGIKDLEIDLEEKQKIFKEKKKGLNNKLFNLEKKIKEVAFLQKKMKVDQAFKKKEKKFKKKAKNLNDLVKGVKSKPKKIKKTKKRTIQMPVQGTIVSDFGEGKDLNKSKYGLVFNVLEDSFITSPFNGIVVFAGKFRSYGNLVIIENDNNFLTILSGMNKIIISTGNEVLKGEPVAKVFVEKENQIYFELRYRGKVIDPKSEVEIL